jgi:hypothetical protein
MRKIGLSGTDLLTRLKTPDIAYNNKRNDDDDESLYCHLVAQDWIYSGACQKF